MRLRYSYDDIQNIALQDRLSVDQFLMENNEFIEENGWFYLILK